MSFEITDRRASSGFGVSRTPTGLYTAGRNFDAVVRDMHSRGYTLPTTGTFARLEARKVVSDLEGARGSATDIANRAAVSDMRRTRLENSRASVGGGFGVRQAANVQMVMPKIRQPLASLMDKGIPFNVQDPKELIELRRWCRLFCATHPLVPLLVEMYSRFPVTGLEFSSKDPKVEQFYTQMFLDDLHYEEFLPDGLLREYFTVGEVSSFSHFNEELGTWASEEILNPDMVRVSKSLFVEEERVQLLVKDMVEQLRDGGEKAANEESPSERLERNWEYQQLVKNYPEIIKAAQQDDGLDISEALVSRLVDKAAWWDVRGTPRLLRSFRTLMMEESLHAAEDAICDRMYSPLLMATLGIGAESMGDGESAWIPDAQALDDVRDDIQSALAGDLRVIVHNMGLNITSVLGRESLPRFDADYDRVDAKLLQTWGVGEALVAGGSGAGGTYASSAINREVCENLMQGAQNKVKRHMRKKMEVIAESQEHWDYDLKGGVRVPIYREIEQYNDETGEKEIVRIPKPLIPDVEFATLNLRDEATERAFVSELKSLGVPISDGRLAINCPIDFEQELETQAAETYAKGMAQAQVMDKLQKKLDADGLPYPAELVEFLQATLTIRAQLAQTEMAESQNKLADQQLAQGSPAGMLGLLPGTTMQPLSGGGMPGAMGADPTGGALPPGQGGNPDPAAAQAASEAQPGATADPTLGAGAPMAMAASTRRGYMMPPTMAPPGGVPKKPGEDGAKDLPRNRAPKLDNNTRPVESDEMRDTMPKTGMVIKAARDEKTGEILRDADGEPILIERRLSKFESGPSSYGRRFTADHKDIERAVRRREIVATGPPSVEDLVFDPDFWATLNMQNEAPQVEADWDKILHDGAPASRRILDEALEQYEEITGVRPYW